MKRRTFLFALVIGFLPQLRAADLPPLVLPQGVGVNIHFTRGHEADLDLIQTAGFKFIRMDFTWASTERERGQYDFSAYDELTANLGKRGLRPLYILDYSNPLYEDPQPTKNPMSGQEERVTISPQHPESVAAFARWAGAVARHYRGRRVIWEIWNEPNISFWRPKPDVTQYITLATATAKTIRAADPDATIVAPASAGFAWEFLEQVLRSDVGPYLDAVSVHPYRGSAPETVTNDYTQLRQLIERTGTTEAQKRRPILSGEWGYSTHAKGVSQETQARYLVRQQLVNVLNGIPVSIWYDWKNDGNDPKENEHNFGTAWPDLRPKPSYQAIEIMTRELGGYAIQQRIVLASPDDYCLWLTNATEGIKVAAWTSAKEHEVKATLPASVQASGAMDMNGAPVSVQALGTTLSLTLTESPCYITLRAWPAASKN